MGVYEVVSMYNEYDDLPRNPAGFCVISLLLGVIGLISVFLLDNGIMGIILGGVGMVFGGYSITLANHTAQDLRMKYMMLAGAGQIASVLSFMIGLTLVF